MKMIPYNNTGKQRKQLVEDISVALHTIPKLSFSVCIARAVFQMVLPTIVLFVFLRQFFRHCRD